MQTTRPSGVRLFAAGAAALGALGVGALVLAVAPGWPGVLVCGATILGVALASERSHRRHLASAATDGRDGATICGIARAEYDRLTDAQLRYELRLRRALGRNPAFPYQGGHLATIRLILAERGQPEAVEEHAEVA